ncbi:unnamed protein product [Xylocopa violacea]|uniref:Ninjurin-1 n=1 Tax=Xylocopa violacea TaxID=135666 RepID=A0ABP1NPZ7_XYLVO
MMHGKDNHREIIDMDDNGDEASKPLTFKLETIVKPHSEFIPEIEDAIKLPPTFGPDIDDFEENEKPSIQSDHRGTDEDLRSGVSEISKIPYSKKSLFYSKRPPFQVIPDVNIYQHKKTLAQGMMDLALLSANANQLRYILQTDGAHPYYYPSLTLIGASLLLQIVVGIGLIWNSRYNVKDSSEMCKAERANNWTVMGIFLVTIFNVFISSFGIVDQLC